MDARIAAKYRKQLTDPRFKEAIRQPLFDTLTYDSGVTTRLPFFAVQAGQGGKTDEDTNLTLAGQLPKGQKFVCDGIEVLIFPGSNAAAYIRQDPVRQAAAVAAPQFANDVHALASTGLAKFKIGTKDYLTDGPLQVFPAQSGLILSAAVEQNLAAAAAQTVSADYARTAGRPYAVFPEIPLEENNNFSFEINWGAAVVLPSGFDARIKVRLLGVLFRN